MNQFSTISYDQAVGLLRRHADGEITLVTAPFPGMSFQFTGTLFVQDDGPFAFAVVAGENLSVSVMPFPECIFQVPSDQPEVEALVASIGGPDEGQEVMMWMVRFQ